MTSTTRDFGGISAMRFLSPGREFLAVADTGHWLFATIARDATGKPAGLEQVRLQPMASTAGKKIKRNKDFDAESLAIRGKEAVVGFEAQHRISRFRIDPQGMSKQLGKNIDFIIPSHELRSNRSFETLAFAPPTSPLEGALVVVTEKSLDPLGNIFAAILDGPQKGIFTVRRSNGFDVTDGAFLDNGDLLLLERSYTLNRGLRMRLRRVTGSDMVKGALVDGPVLFQADMTYQIDNMEALDVWRRADGATMISIMSDDNQLILQRNLYLEFILHEE
ncbi:esterase-like activity of phytase family protein [Aquamicrobium segne]|uniref:Esterase-like activity of phytase family protein n=1 Tax=Aquamicrobium segne TaxID=469547 RepID=A0ABW0H188_9HYPH